MMFDNVGAEQDYRFPRRDLPDRPPCGRMRFAVYLICSAVAGYLLAANILLRIA